MSYNTRIKQYKKLKNEEIISFEFEGEIKCMNGIISDFRIVLLKIFLSKKI